MLIQVKGNYETVGVSAEVEVGNCAAQQVHEKTNTISMERYKYKDKYRIRVS